MYDDNFQHESLRPRGREEGVGTDSMWFGVPGH